MKKNFLLLSVLSLGTLTLSECSKVNEATPTPSTIIATTGIQVVNSRLVFANQQAFDKALNELSTLTSNGVDLWRKNIAFYSLQEAYRKELPSIEELIQSKKAPAYQLIEEFGFPYFYTVILNPEGEYQVGDKIYWCHSKSIYEANSEKELADIKQNPAICKVKYATTSSEVRAQSPKDKSRPTSYPSATTRVTSQPGGSYSNDKWIYDYNKNGDTGSKRRWIFSTRIFSTEQPRTNNNTTQNWRSYMSIIIKHLYYSFGSRTWYPITGSFFSYARIDKFDGTAYVNNFSGTSASYSIANQPEYTNTTNAYTDQTTVFNSAFVYISNDASSRSASESDVYFTYEIDGSLMARETDESNYSQFLIAGGPGYISGPHMW
jgi:hypothetical protein